MRRGDGCARAGAEAEPEAASRVAGESSRWVGVELTGAGGRAGAGGPELELGRWAG